MSGEIEGEVMRLMFGTVGGQTVNRIDAAPNFREWAEAHDSEYFCQLWLRSGHPKMTSVGLNAFARQFGSERDDVLAHGFTTVVRWIRHRADVLGDRHVYASNHNGRRAYFSTVSCPYCVFGRHNHRRLGLNIPACDVPSLLGVRYFVTTDPALHWTPMTQAQHSVAMSELHVTRKVLTLS